MNMFDNAAHKGREIWHWLDERVDRGQLLTLYIVIGAIVLSGSIFPFLKIHPGLAFTRPYLLYPLFILFLLATGLFLLLSKWRELRPLLAANPLLLALVGWMLVSLLWTLSPHSRPTALIGLLTSTLYGFHLALYQPRRKLLRLLGLVALGLLAGSLLYTYYFHTMSFAPATPKAMAGLFSNKNIPIRLACFATVLAVFLLVWQEDNARQKDSLALRLSWLVLFLMGLWMVARYYAFTAKVSVPAAGAAIMLALTGARNKRLFLVTSGILALLAVVFLLFFNEIIAMARETSGLHNRFYHWSQMIAQHDTSRWFGAGLGGFWDRVQGPWQHLHLLTPLTHGHNGFMDTWLDLGFVGLFLVLANMALMVWRHLQRPFVRWHPLHYFASATFVVFVIYNLTESSLLPTNSANTFLWAIFVALIMSSVPQDRLNTREKL